MLQVQRRERRNQFLESRTDQHHAIGVCVTAGAGKKSENRTWNKQFRK
jgi:hypothetical protein